MLVTRRSSLHHEGFTPSLPLPLSPASCLLPHTSLCVSGGSLRRQSLSAQEGLTGEARRILEHGPDTRNSNKSSTWDFLFSRSASSSCSMRIMKSISMEVRCPWERRRWLMSKAKWRASIVAEGAKDRRVKSIQVQYNTWWGTPTFQTLEIGVSSKR